MEKHRYVTVVWYLSLVNREYDPGFVDFWIRKWGLVFY